MSEIELLRCPFCGGIPTMLPFEYAVFCPICFAKTIRVKNEQDAINHWNMRTNTPSDLRIEKLEAAIKQAAFWFDEYAQIHKKKGNTEKALINIDRSIYLKNILCGDVKDDVNHG